MQTQNNMEVCCVKFSYVKGLTTILKKNVQIWNKDNNFYGIFNDFELTLLLSFYVLQYTSYLQN